MTRPLARVLIVDDEPFVALCLTAVFEDHGVESEVVGSGEEALELAACTEYDVVLVDLRLPVMQGDDLIPRLHEMRPDLKFIIHTGSTWFELTDGLKRAGVRREHLLYKPVDDLTDIVRVVLDLTRSGPGGTPST